MTRSKKTSRTSGKRKTVKKPETLVETATSFLRDQILSLSLEPGSRIDDGVLFDRFNLSRTPAREAMNRLSAEGLIIIKGNRGANVAPLDLDHVQDLFVAYITCERTVGFLCRFEDEGLVEDLVRIQGAYAKVQKARELLEITNHNAAFHNRIAQATQNKFVTDYAHRLYGISRRISYYVYKKERGEGDFFAHAEKIDKHHERLIEQIKEHDRKAFIAMLTEHALLFSDRVKRTLFESKSQDFEPDWSRVCIPGHDS